MTNPPYVLRPMHANDLMRVMQIAAQARKAPQWPLSAYLTALDPIATPRRMALVIGDATSDQLFGFAIASIIPPGAELESIAISESCRRQGLGRELLAQLLHALRQEDIREVWLEVRPTNLPAIALYRRAGFVESGVRNSYYADPVEDASVMTRTMP